LEHTNAFEGLEPYSVGLIRYKSRRLIGILGLTESDRDDIEQEMAVHLRQNLSKHDPARGSVKTFINCVLDNRVKAIIKSRTCSAFDCSIHAYSLDAAFEAGDSDEVTKGDILDTDEYRIRLGNATRPLLELVELRVDVLRVVASLPDDLQRVCEALSHSTVAASARELGISRPKLYEMMRGLRDVFSEAGVQLHIQ
jgi:RNA polymerase sigma-70 factor, ECF subfamily